MSVETTDKLYNLLALNQVNCRDELSPCPFCGSNARLWIDNTSHRYPAAAIVGCMNDDCEMTTPPIRSGDGDIVLAVKWARQKWNRRATEHPANAESLTKV